MASEQDHADWLAQRGWTCHPPGQSCVSGSHAYVGKQRTSAAAAVGVAPKSGTQRRLLLEYLRTGPATDPEMQEALRLVPNSQRPRRKELVDGGFVADSGAVRRHHGRDHILWALTAKGATVR